MGNYAEKEFLSLKWKLFRLLAVVFFFIAVGVSWTAYYQQERQLQFEQKRLQQQSLNELNGQIKQIQEALIQQAEYLALLAETDDGSSSLDSLLAGVRGNLSNLTLLSSVEKIAVFAPKNKKIFDNDNEGSDLSTLSAIAQQKEEPSVDLSCATDCRVAAAIPLLLSEGVGAIAVDTSIADVVVRVNRTAGWDIGVLVSAGDRSSADMGLWKLNISALSNRSHWQSLLQQYSYTEAFSGAGQYFIEQNGRRYSMALIPLEHFKSEGAAYWILLKEVTESYQMIRQNNIQLLAVTWFSLLLSALLLAMFLQPSLRALSLVASALPSLAHHDFDFVRTMLKKSGDVLKQRRKDELGLLADSTVALTDELERLNREVKNRTLRLYKSSRELAKQREFVAGLLDNAQAIILVQDRNGLCRSINQFGRLLISRPESLCVNYHFEDLFGFVIGSDRVQLELVYGGSKNVYRHEMTLNASDGSQRTISWLHSRLKQRDHSDAVLSIGMDITEHKAVQSQLFWLANHDPLTELPNRSGLQNQLQMSIDSSHSRSRPFAVLFCGLDHFKNVNDSLGHPAGDKLIKQAAQRMRSLVREQDTVARWGGDEYVVVINDANCHEDIHALADKLVSRMDQAYHIDNHEVYASVSIGIAIYPEHGGDATTLVKHADIAMYKAKQDGRKQYAIYSSEQSLIYEERLHLDVDLRYALDRQELLLYYQPQLSNDGRTVIGVEALLRWIHPDQGMIPPDRFIPLAEETGQIIEIGAWVLREACSQLRQWQAKGVNNVRISVNLAGPQIVDSALLERVEQVLETTGLPADMLELEITESFIMSHPESTIAKLQQLKDLGIKLSIDDFGTGYSSLSYLKKLPIDKLKIDKSFVFDIGLCGDDEAITKAVIALGHSLNLTVIAEGVENDDHVRFLKENGCDELQGFHFSKPLPADECLEFLLAHQEPAKLTV
ncbi:MAG: EAL domain-containing protein [Motiliproteus sp.]|nr:EAL domain-containing protein [Motiliproteus sp.]MCW9052376.1 EAL domain-containing protein [Motiliproteus sp.]